MNSSRQKEIRHAQRESFLLRELSTFFLRITQDEPSFSVIYIDRVKLSSDSSLCTVFFYSDQGKEAFEKVMPQLILYKPSIRASLAKVSSGRYVPQLKFRYAEQIDKQRRVDELIDRLKREGKL